MATPKWAQDLTLNTLIFANCDRLPEITWRHSKTELKSSGCAYRNGRIVVTAGRDRVDQRLVLLHELAHFVRPANEHHSPEFWDLAWQLYRWAKLPIRYCKAREGNYRVGAIAAYHRGKAVVVS